MGRRGESEAEEGKHTPVMPAYRSDATRNANMYSPQSLVQESELERAVTLTPSVAGVPSGDTEASDLPRVTRTEERYAMHDLLGEGGMGEVRACTDMHIGREVAMKAMRPAQFARADLRTRFLREARIQGQLEHPAVVPVYDLGFHDEGALYFTMRRVRGDGRPATARRCNQHRLRDRAPLAIHASRARRPANCGTRP